MNESVQKIANEALLLTREDRAELIDTLLRSLNPPAQSGLDILWAEEAEKRVRDCEEGKVKALDGGQVLKDIQEHLKQ